MVHYHIKISKWGVPMAVGYPVQYLTGFDGVHVPRHLSSPLLLVVLERFCC